MQFHFLSPSTSPSICTPLSLFASPSVYSLHTFLLQYLPPVVLLLYISCIHTDIPSAGPNFSSNYDSISSLLLAPKASAMKGAKDDVRSPGSLSLCIADLTDSLITTKMTHS